MKARDRREAGFSLVIVVAIIALLSFLGILVLNSAWIDIEQAGTQREFHSALYVAETGIAWGKARLDAAPYGFGGDAPKPGELKNGTAVDVEEACPEGGACERLDWFLLDTAEAVDDWIPFVPTDSGRVRGWYRVFGAVDAERDPDVYPDLKEWRVLLRAIGKTPGGAKRMIEVVLGPAPST